MKKHYYKECARRKAAESEAEDLRLRLRKAKDMLSRYAIMEGHDPEVIIARLDDYPLPDDPERWKDALMFYMMEWLNRAPHTRAQWDAFA